MEAKRKQRIRMKVRERAAKVDGTITACGPAMDWFDVEFDGPVVAGTKVGNSYRFWQWGTGNLVTDKPPLKAEATLAAMMAMVMSDAKLWEVL